MSETLRDPVLASLFNQYALELVDMKLQSTDNCNRVLRTMTIAERPWKDTFLGTQTISAENNIEEIMPRSTI